MNIYLDFALSALEKVALIRKTSYELLTIIILENVHYQRVTTNFLS